MSWGVQRLNALERGGGPCSGGEAGFWLLDMFDRLGVEYDVVDEAGCEITREWPVL